MDDYISYSGYRREVWKGHASRKAVRRAIAYDRGLNRLVLFKRVSVLRLDGNWHDEYQEVPRSGWDEEFADA